MVIHHHRGAATTWRLGAGDDRYAWNSGDGSDVEGQTGIDTLPFNGRAPTILRSRPMASACCWHDVGNVTMDINGVEKHRDQRGRAMTSSSPVPVWRSHSSRLMEVQATTRSQAATAATG
jgi:hypothetical protein